jgi:dienelactone hydrolase
VRPSDIALLCAAALAGAVLVRGHGRLRGTTGLVLVTAVVWQIVDGWRWQLVPALAVVGVGAGLVVAGRAGTRGVAWRRTALTVAVVAVLVATGLAVALPVTGLPRPTGPLPVGTVTFVVEDAGREDPYGTGSRRFPVQVWYPAVTAGPPAPWIESDTVGAFSANVTTWLGLPPFALRHLRLVATNASEATAPAAGPHPVVVYSHGWGGFRSIQSDLAEDLASHGYVVVAPDHTYGALATQFPGGEVVGIEPSALPEPEDVSEQEYDLAARLLEQTYAEDLLAALEVVGAPDDHRLEPGAAARNVLEALDLDMRRIVMTGHSTGGGAATWACHELAGRCVGVVGFDPWLAPVPNEYLSEGSAVPYVALRSEEWLALPNDEIVKDYLDGSAARTWRLAIPGSNHRDFTLMGFLSPLARTLGLAGEVPAADLHAAVNLVARTLADHATRGAPTTLLDTPQSAILTPR